MDIENHITSAPFVNDSTPLQGPPDGTPAATEAPFVINIGRQLGSGGREIGQWLAREMGIAYYDKEILSLAAEESGFNPEFFERNDERKGFFRSVLGTITPLISAGGDFYGNSLSDESLFRIQSEAIRSAARRGSCVFIGRCADYVLRDFPRCVNVFIVADPADRLRRICDHEKVTQKVAQRMMENGDEKRASFYNFYSAGTWGAAETYHLCVNSSVLGIEGTAQLIKDFALRKLSESQKEATE